MKRLITLLLGLGLFLLSYNAYAFIGVGDLGETGWQTYSTSFDESWIGQAGVAVSNYGDYDSASVLLIDNLSHGPSGNLGFESDLTGYTTQGSGVSVVSSFTSYNGNVYTPTEGNNMAFLSSYGADTSAYGGTNGSYLWITDKLSFDTGDTFTFDWAFLAFDAMPFQDFAIVLHEEDSGFEADKLAQIVSDSAVPEPTTLLLLGSGILGLLGIGGVSKRKADSRYTR